MSLVKTIIPSPFFIYFMIALFLPIPIVKTTNLLVGILPLLLWGKYLIKINHSSKWYLFIMFFVFIRLLSQFAFFDYQSPYIYGDSYRLFMFLASVYIFTELFKNKNNISHYSVYVWRFSLVLIIAIILSNLFNWNLVTIDAQNRFRWFAWSNSGGPGFSKVFTFMGIIYLFHINRIYPKLQFDKRIIHVMKVMPHVIFCVLGGTRLQLFVFFIAILLYLKIPKKLIALIPILTYLFFNIINELASLLPGFGRLQIDGGGVRLMIWQNFIEKIFESTSTFWWGYGPGYILIDIYDPISGSVGGYFHSTHNLFIQLWLGYGVIIFAVSIIIYIMFIYRVVMTKHENNLIYGIMAFVMVTELFGTSYMAYDSSWTLAASYALLLISINENKNGTLV
jgi:hypothetical protein